MNILKPNMKTALKRKGFTLVELIIVILVVAILAVALIATLNGQQNQAKESGVNVDYHSYYIAAKSAILSDIDGELTTREKFIIKMNEYLDSEMQFDEITAISNQVDPWNGEYKFHYYSWNNPETGLDEYWVAFTSEGVMLRNGWIFTPDYFTIVGQPKVMEPNLYSRKGLDTRNEAGNVEYKYIMLLGYHSGGDLIDKISEADKEVLIHDILNDAPAKEYKILFIDDVKYYADPDMTVSEWVASDYNRDGYKLSDGKLVNSANKDVMNEDKTVQIMSTNTTSGGTEPYHWYSMTDAAKHFLLMLNIEEEDEVYMDYDELHEADPNAVIYYGSVPKSNFGEGASSVYRYWTTGNTEWNLGGYPYERKDTWPYDLPDKIPAWTPYIMKDSNENWAFLIVSEWTDDYKPSLHWEDHNDFDHMGYVSGSTSAKSIQTGFAEQGYVVDTSTQTTSNNGGVDYINQNIECGNGNYITLSFKESDSFDIGDGQKWFNPDSEVTLTAHAGEGYTFGYWKKDGAKNSTNETVTFVMTADTSFSAVFKKALHVGANGRAVDANENTTASLVQTKAEYRDTVISSAQAIVNEEASTLWNYTLSGNNATLTKYKGDIGTADAPISISVPTKIDGHPVVKVGSNSTIFNSSYPYVSKLTIPSGVNVGNIAFSNTHFTNAIINIGDEINIGSSAFRGASIDTSTINKLVIGNNVYINEQAFRDNTINNLIIGIGLTSFSGSNSSTMPFYTTSIKNISIDSDIPGSLFSGCSVESLTLGSHVSTIGTKAFWKNKLSILPDVSNVDNIGQEAFRLNTVHEITGNLNIKSGATVGQNAFEGFQFNNVNISIGNGVSVGADAFRGYSKATSAINKVVMGNDVELKSQAFRANTINSIVIGTGLKTNITYSDSGPFYSCTVKNVSIDSDVATILFKECEVESLTLGSHVSKIGNSAFYYNKLSVLPDISNVDIIEQSALYGNGQTVTGDIVIKSGATTGASAFSNMVHDNTTITIGDNSTIGGSAFYGVYGKTSTSIINKVEVGNTVNLGSNAFQYNTINKLILPTGAGLSSSVLSGATVNETEYK